MSSCLHYTSNKEWRMTYIKRGWCWCIYTSRRSISQVWPPTWMQADKDLIYVSLYAWLAIFAAMSPEVNLVNGASLSTAPKPNPSVVDPDNFVLCAKYRTCSVIAQGACFLPVYHVDKERVRVPKQPRKCGVICCGFLPVDSAKIDMQKASSIFHTVKIDYCLGQRRLEM